MSGHREICKSASGHRRAQTVPGFERPMLLNYYVTGAVTEASASRIYPEWMRSLVAMDEKDFALTGLKQISEQEPYHLSFYRMQGRLLRSEMPPYEVRLARFIKNRGHMLPGADTLEHKRQLGHVLGEVVDVRRLGRLALPLQGVYDDMMDYASQGGKVPGMVLRGLRDSFDLADQVEHVRIIDDLMLDRAA